MIEYMKKSGYKSQEELDHMVKVMRQFVISNDKPSMFYELNNLLIEAISVGVPVVMVDMPEVLLRMKIGNDLTLKELEDIFNTVVNRIKDK